MSCPLACFIRTSRQRSPPQNRPRGPCSSVPQIRHRASSGMDSAENARGCIVIVADQWRDSSMGVPSSRTRARTAARPSQMPRGGDARCACRAPGWKASAD
jgi:hypothetical protein